MKSTFSIIFYLKRQVVKKDGTVPVMGRITVDGTQAQFSCKTTANPDLWDTKGGRMIGKSMQALEVNRKLDKMRVSISKHYQEIMDRDNFVTADKVKNAFLGLEYRCHTLMKVYSQSRDEMEKQYKAGMKSLSTYTKYRIGCAYVGEFLQTHYHVKDIALKELSLPFITDYETFLRTDKHLKINSAMVFVRNLRAMVFRAIDNEWLVKDPFRRYEYKEEETTREFLSKEEIHLLMETPITRKKMSMVRELFRQLMSRLTLERVRIEQNCIYIDPRISFNEIDRFFFSGCACAYFQIAVDVYTDLRIDYGEWLDLRATYNIWLMGYDDGNRLRTVKFLCDNLGLGLNESKALVDSAPCKIASGKSQEDIDAFRKAIKNINYAKFKFVAYEQ